MLLNYNVVLYNIYIHTNIDYPVLFMYVANLSAGQWSVSVKRGTSDLSIADEMWSTLSMSCIGEWIQHSEYINGIVVSPRKYEIRIQVWTRDGNNEPVQMEIGRKLKEIMKINERIEYKLFHTKSKGPEYIL